jgi:hypothetical protein
MYLRTPTVAVVAHRATAPSPGLGDAGAGERLDSSTVLRSPSVHRRLSTISWE